MRLPAWRLVFIAEGVIGISIGVYMFKFLDSGLRSARFLTDDQIYYLVTRQQSQKALRNTRHAENGIFEVIHKLWFGQILIIWTLHHCGYITKHHCFQIFVLCSLHLCYLYYAYSSTFTWRKARNKKTPRTMRLLFNVRMFLRCYCVALLLFVSIAMSGIWSMLGKWQIWYSSR